MKRIGILAMLVLAISLAFTITNLWKVVNADEIIVNFTLDGEDVTGTIKGVDAQIDLDRNDISKSSILASVDVKNLSTEDSKRDEHLMSSDFFDATKYPKITFKSSSIKKSKKGYIAVGKLTMKDKTLDVKVPFQFDVDDNGGATFSGEMKVYPQLFGVTSGEKGKGGTVSISVIIPLVK